MTSLEPKTPHSADQDIPDTQVIAVSSPAPVFVDSTGRRRKVLRGLAYAFGALCVLYGALVSVSLAGGPVSSRAVLPLPDLQDKDNEVVQAKPRPIPTPAVTSAPRPQFVAEALRRPTRTRDNRADAFRPRTASPSPIRSPRPLWRMPAPRISTSAKPVESAATRANPSTPAPGSPATSSSAPAPEPPAEVPPAPPVPSQSTGTGGGIGGGDTDADGGGSGTEQTTPPAGQLLAGTA